MVVRLYQDDEILNIIHPLCDLYTAVFQANAAESDLFTWRVQNSVHNKRKPVVITVSLENELVGAIFGFDYLPENYWAKNVQAHLPSHKDWFKSSFEINEIFVKSNFQGKGIGGKLLETLMNSVAHDNFLLSTAAFKNDHVLRFYKQNRFKVLIDQFKFENTETVYSILALENDELKFNSSNKG